jgi:hypothetical protein
MTKKSSRPLRSELHQLGQKLLDELRYEAALTEALEKPLDAVEADILGHRREENPADTGDRTDGVVGFKSPLARQGRVSKTGDTWRAFLSIFEPVAPLVSGSAPLANEPTDISHAVLQKPLAEIFDSKILCTELNWSAGFLRVAYAKDSNGLIQSISGGVKRSQTESVDGSTIILIFQDPHGVSKTLKLTAGRPFQVAHNAGLEGDIMKIEIAVSLVQTH